jgi:hypothetical protein
VEEYEEQIEVNIIMQEEDVPKMHVMSESILERWPTNMTIEECLQNLNRVMESTDCEEWRKLEAIDVFSSRVKRLNDRKNYFTTKRSEMIQVMNVRTRAAQKQERTTNLLDSQASLTKETVESSGTYTESIDDFTSYEEYDKAYEASQVMKKRVRFEQELVEDNNTTVPLTQTKPPQRTLRTRKDSVKPKTSRNEELDLAEKTSGPDERERVGVTDDKQELDVSNAEESEIDQEDDFILANFLMENKVKL